jgi:hypothetical protein
VFMVFQQFKENIFWDRFRSISQHSATSFLRVARHVQQDTES